MKSYERLLFSEQVNFGLCICSRMYFMERGVKEGMWVTMKMFGLVQFIRNLFSTKKKHLFYNLNLIRDLYP